MSMETVKVDKTGKGIGGGQNHMSEEPDTQIKKGKEEEKTYDEKEI